MFVWTTTNTTWQVYEHSGGNERTGEQSFRVLQYWYLGSCYERAPMMTGNNHPSLHMVLCYNLPSFIALGTITPPQWHICKTSQVTFETKTEILYYLQPSQHNTFKLRINTTQNKLTSEVTYNTLPIKKINIPFAKQAKYCSMGLHKMNNLFSKHSPG